MKLNVTRKTNTKRTWGSEETKIVIEFFKKEKCVPGKAQCEICINNSNNVLASLS